MSEPIEIDLPPHKDEPAPRYYNRDEPVSTNYLHIELSKDLNVEALTEEIKKGMDRAAAQIRGQGHREQEKQDDAYRDWCRENGFQWMHVDPPGPNRKIRWIAPDGTMQECDAPLPQKYYFQASNPIAMDEQSVRSLIREEVHRALYPDAALANPHEHRRIEMTEESGKKWRGVLYAVDEGE